eukprot:4191959-Pyramimonas_sp.AAC.1
MAAIAVGARLGMAGGAVPERHQLLGLDQHVRERQAMTAIVFCVCEAGSGSYLYRCVVQSA